MLGTRWLPVAAAPYCKVPSHKKSSTTFAFLQEHVDGLVSQLGLDNAVMEAVQGGVVDTRGPVLYGSWMKLESLNIGNA